MNDTSESTVLVLTAEKRDNVEKNLEEEDLRDAISEFDSTGSSNSYDWENHSTSQLYYEFLGRMGCTLRVV